MSKDRRVVDLDPAGRAGGVHLDRAAAARVLVGDRRAVRRLSPAAIAWHVVSADLPWATPPDAWVGSTIRFEIAPTPEGSTLTFTHEGLVPEHDCYGVCESAWTVLLEKNLVTLLASGEDQPSPWR